MARRRALTTAATARCSRWDSYQRSAAAASSASLGWDKRMACWLRAAPLSTAPLSTAHAGCWDSTLQLQGDKCAHGNDQSITGSHASKELPRRWLILSLWPSSWQAMRRRSGLPSLRGARIAVGACASIVFRVAAAENAPVPYEADSAVHSCLAIRISKEKRCAQRIYYLQRIA